MKTKEFVKICKIGGYSPISFTKSYIKNNKKDTYKVDDIIAVTRLYEEDLKLRQRETGNTSTKSYHHTRIQEDYR